MALEEAEDEEDASSTLIMSTTKLTDGRGRKSHMTAVTCELAYEREEKVGFVGGRSAVSLLPMSALSVGSGRLDQSASSATRVSSTSKSLTNGESSGGDGSTKRRLSEL